MLGLSLASEDNDSSRNNNNNNNNRSPHAVPTTTPGVRHRDAARRATPRRDMSATATATYAFSSPEPYAFSFSTPERLRTRPAPHFGRSHSEDANSLVKRSFEPRLSVRTSGDMAVRAEGSEGSRASTPGAQPHRWLRRLSTSITSSRDSSRTPVSRPGSAAVSQSNGSLAFSRTGSTTPMFQDATPPSSLPPNKLVKRSSSLRSSSSSLFHSSSPGSRLPLPTFRRPATSHQRSADLLEHGFASSTKAQSEASNSPRDSQWRHYFTPKVVEKQSTPLSRRRASSIPNPIKRVYPDRRYTPTLVSARNPIRKGEVEADYDFDLYDEGEAITMPASVASSPMLGKEELPPPSRRSFSFSISDLLATGPSSNSGNRPPSSRSRSFSSRLTRSTNRRIVSAPQSTMGTSFSSSRNESERPSKRRETVEPETSSRSFYSTSSATPASDLSAPHEIQLNLASEAPQPTTPSAAHPMSVEAPMNAPPHSSFEQRRLPSATIASAAQRPVRLSGATSEITSTLGSDEEYRSVGDASTDYQSDAFYDSFPTRTTRSSSGKRGPPIETIFDESPPTFSSGRSTKLKDFLNTGTFPGSEHSERYRYSTIEEEESISTPVRSLADKSLTSSPSANAGARNGFTSSPPVIGEVADPDEIDWDASDEEVEAPRLRSPASTGPSASGPHYQFTLPFRLGPFAKSQHSSSATSTPQRNGAAFTDRATIFDWAETQPSPSHNESPPRPKTVHGKKDPENRGSRPPGRRAPSGMHARSHSVPVVPDVEGKRTSAVANKFGTWGVGSKAVTEDWNEDFDFDDGPPELPIGDILDKRIDSGHAMFVPKSIREQQQNVVANISLLREWGLLIEELKELRMRAVALGMLSGPHARDWGEVDAMIELADQESDEATLEPRHSPPSSPGFDYTAFDEPLREAVQTARARAQSIRAGNAAVAISDPPAIFLDEPSTPVQPLAPRPRKDSEAVARSVIEAIQIRRAVSEPPSLQLAEATKKVPFDTATLRHIVPYVNGLKRRMKDALRETEGLYTSPRRHSGPDEDSFGGFDDDEDDEPSFRSIFNEPVSASPLQNRLARRTRAVTDNDEAEK